MSEIKVHLLNGDILTTEWDENRFPIYVDDKKVIEILFPQVNFYRDVAGWKIGKSKWQYRVQSIGLQTGYTGQYVSRKER